MLPLPRTQVFLHPQMRALLSRSAQRNLRSRLFTRLNSTERSTAPARSTTNSPTQHAKTTIRRGPPERILIYNGGTGKTMFLATVRLTSLFLFGISCVYVAPFYENPDAPWYTIPAIVLGGALPMIFIAYNAAPYVNFVHLALPAFARRSREQTIQYAKSLPPDAILHINTMRITTMPRHTTVRLGDLVPDKLMFRPISFRNTKPKPVPWYRGGVLKEFYTDPESKPGRHSSIFYPELWKHVYRQIQSNRPTHRK